MTTSTSQRARVVNRFGAGGSTVIMAHALQISAPLAQPPVEHFADVDRPWHRLGAHSRIDG